MTFRHSSRFDARKFRRVAIALRWPGLFEEHVAAAVRMLWLHDVDVGDALTDRIASKVDHILCLSGWHERHLSERYPFATDKLVRVGNGIDHRLFDPKPWSQRAPRVVYTSNPSRGLAVLLQLWPEVRERVPDAELHHCHAPVYDGVAARDPLFASEARRIRQLPDHAGVRALGSLSQPDLATLLCDARVWCHPSWVAQRGVPFYEVCPISVIEAQAAGCRVVASDWGALSEMVRCGALIKGPGMTRRWKDAFVDHVAEGLADAAVGAWAVDNAPRAVAGMDWDAVAAAVAQLVASASDQRLGAAGSREAGTAYDDLVSRVDR